MLLDNHTTLLTSFSVDKTPAVDLSCQECSCGLSDSSSDHSSCPSSPAASLPSSPSSLSFAPRPFPPPSLTDVPIEYIINQLHSLAPRYFNKPETADCTLIVPVPHGNMQGSLMEAFSPTPGNHRTDPVNRRATAPCMPTIPTIRLQLHVDYLSAHSTFLRGLFSGASPLDLINTSPAPAPAAATTNSSGFTVPPNRQPRLLPSSPDHPMIYLPVPDPSSINLLIHWMYFGHTGLIEEALNSGVIQWEGIARNVEYLGLSRGIKVFLGQWYQDWLNPQPQPPSQESFNVMSRPASPDFEPGDDGDDEESDDEDEFDDCMEWSDEEDQAMDLCVVVKELDIMDHDDRGRLGVRSRPLSLQH